jgi:pyrroline-5-carboxylate reductase
VVLAKNAKEVINSCLIVFLCVKPYALEDVAESLREKDSQKAPESSQLGRKNSTLVSILAGIELKDIKKALPMFDSYMRAMPNTPLQVGAGCTAVTPVIGIKKYETEFNVQVVKEIFGYLGVAEVVEESKLHAITALSGSGPAYAYLFIEALSDAALKQGLPRDLATKFAAQTLYGASKTLLENPSITPSELKNQVTSSGGTTIYGLHELERYGFRNATFMCIEAATNRSREMSKK